MFAYNNNKLGIDILHTAKNNVQRYDFLCKKKKKFTKNAQIFAIF